MSDKKSGKYSKKAILGICGMLIFGTGTMISSKLMLDTSACPEYDKKLYPGVEPWVHGGCPKYLLKKFEKPWYQTGVMFSAMLFCIFGHLGSIWYEGKKARKQATEAALIELGSDEPIKHKSESWKNYIYVGLPSIFDMVATTVMTLGLVYIDVSIMQMLRGSLVVFAAIYNVFLLKRKIRAYQWTAVGVTVCALVLVGISCVMGSIGSTTAAPPSKQLYGCFLVLISQLIQATQIVAEDFLMSGIQAEPLQVVGMEGVWGILITCAICWPIMNAIPGSDSGRVENVSDTFYMFVDNPIIIAFTVVYWISILMLNWAGMVLTNETSSVVRSIFESVRTVAIWVTDLAIYYLFAPHSVYGESWTTYSWLQAAGFTLLIFGSQMYNGYVKYSIFKYDFAEKIEIKANKENIALIDYAET